MQPALPPPEPERAPADPLAFTPVPRRYRHDGWTAERQRGFIHALAETGSVKAAARRIGKTTEGAYHMRRQPGADSFRAAWEAALASGVQRLTDIAMERAVEGVPIPVFHKGEQVGERRWYNDRLLMFMLKHHQPDRYGAAAAGQRALAPGTKHPETIAREAAKQCPVCREREETAARRAFAEAEAAKQSNEEFLAHLMRTYQIKVQAERRERLAGDWAAADFYLRQLNFFELILEGCGHRMDLIDMHTIENGGEDMYDRQINCGPLTPILDKMRREIWEAAGEPPRPPIDLREFLPHTNMSYQGDTAKERQHARAEAQRRIAASLAVWEASATEETWAAFKAASGR
ncbi:hypothetical protein [Sphingomonas sp.]|jgi:hypothetical protein|uniref:hypothetical protein n=1 Tax=Sphingomonas sp. TaxID=28214 RepID=UPI002615491C|nr:hypothetical protein [Sphingomonas sp.]MDF2495304.1 hypothetical protein [Sphingomonas sp.]